MRMLRGARAWAVAALLVVCLAAGGAAASADECGCHGATAVFSGASWERAEGALLLDVAAAAEEDEACAAAEYAGTLAYTMADGALAAAGDGAAGAVAAPAERAASAVAVAQLIDEPALAVRLLLVDGERVVVSEDVALDAGVSREQAEALPVGPCWVSQATLRAYFLVPLSPTRTELHSVALDGTGMQKREVAAPAVLRRGADQTRVAVFDSAQVVRLPGDGAGCLSELFFSFTSVEMQYVANSTGLARTSVLPNGAPAPLITLNAPVSAPAPDHMGFTLVQADGSASAVSLSTQAALEALGVPYDAAAPFEWTTVLWVALSVAGSFALFAMLIGGAWLIRQRRKARAAAVEFHL